MGKFRVYYLYVYLLVYKEAKKIQADLYHLHDPELLLIAKKLKKIGHVIFDSHEFTAEQIREKFYIPLILRRPLSSLYKYMEKGIIGKIDGLIVPCTYNEKDYFKGCYRKVAYVDNVPIITELKLPKIPYEERRINAIYLGNITLQRGAKEMVQAAYGARIRLNMAGEFSPYELKTQLENMKEYISIDYLGVLNQQQVQNILSNCKIGICILQNSGQYSKLDNLPTKVYEYMAAGMPVITSDFPYYKKIIEGNYAGICVDPANIEAIIKAICYLIKCPQKAEIMGRNGRKLVEEKFNWEQEQFHLYKLYNEVLY